MRTRWQSPGPVAVGRRFLFPCWPSVEVTVHSQVSPHFWTFLAPSTPHLQWCVRAFSGFEPLTFSSEIGWRKFSASRGSLVRSGPLKTSPFCQTTRSPPLVVFTGCSHTQEAIPRGEGQPIHLGSQTASWRRQPGRPCALKRGRWALQTEGGPLCSLRPPSLESLPKAS